jgi:hypothetical protein
MRTRAWSLLPGLAVAALVTSCGGEAAITTFPSPVETTFERLAEHDGERVVVEGYLATDSSIGCPESICWLWLTPEPVSDDGAMYGTPDDYVNLLIPEDWNDPYPNTIRDVPMVWSPEQVVVTSDDMTEVHLNDRIRVTGWVEVDEQGHTSLAGTGRPCGNTPGGQETLDLLESFGCPDTGFVIVLPEPEPGGGEAVSTSVGSPLGLLRPVRSDAEAADFEGTWTGFSVDKPDKGTSTDTLTIIISEPTSEGMLDVLLQGTFTESGEQQITGIKAVNGMLTFETPSRGGEVIVWLGIDAADDRVLIGEADPAPDNDWGDASDIELNLTE